MARPRSRASRVTKLPPKTLVGKYVLGERLGVGGMAEVYEAQYIGSPDRVSRRALKLILPQWSQHPDMANMFRGEARLSRMLNHPSIVKVTDSGEAEGRLYIAMEFIDGISSARLMRLLEDSNQRLGVDTAVYIAVRSLSGLAYAHNLRSVDGKRLGIVHRDVSPGNILLSRGGEVKLTDFGIALSDDLERNTQPGEVKGKYGYMSPEQIAGIEIDHRTDLFSLGIVLAELLIGKRLFTGKNQYELLTRMHLADTSAFEQSCGDLPGPIVEVVRRALQRRRRDRFQSAMEFLAQLLSGAAASGIEVNESSLARCLFEIGVMHPNSGTHERIERSSSPPTLEPTTVPRD